MTLIHNTDTLCLLGQWAHFTLTQFTVLALKLKKGRILVVRKWHLFFFKSSIGDAMNLKQKSRSLKYKPLISCEAPAFLLSDICNYTHSCIIVCWSWGISSCTGYLVPGLFAVDTGKLHCALNFAPVVSVQRKEFTFLPHWVSCLFFLLGVTNQIFFLLINQLTNIINTINIKLIN